MNIMIVRRVATTVETDPLGTLLVVPAPNLNQVVNRLIEVFDIDPKQRPDDGDNLREIVRGLSTDGEVEFQQKVAVTEEQEDIETIHVEVWDMAQHKHVPLEEQAYESK